ncbi:MAG: bestrophin family ion channel [Flavobacteriales bacterium]|nr:bestrophin family ion channel [Flavobacteriales bacterium]
MINYNPKEWFSFVFRIHKADTVRRLMPMLVAIMIYSIVVAWLEQDFLRLSENNKIKNLPILHTLLGFAISMLLVFRTNTAYDRWWEGRKLWGALVNNSRNLAMKMSSILPTSDLENRNFFRISISSYATALSKHLKSSELAYEMYDGEDSLWKHIRSDKHVPNQIAGMIIKRTVDLRNENKITGDHLLFLNPELQSFTDICGACERIKNTPIPFSYNIFLKKFIFLYVMTLPFGLVINLGYWVAPVVTLIFYVLVSLEIIAEEIEEPFGVDANDLPTDKIAQNIAKSVSELI